MSYVIEDNVPLPPNSNKTGRPRGAAHPLLSHVERLQPGQSIPLNDYDDYRVAGRAAARWRPNRYTVRKQRHGWRIWRIA